MIDSKKDEIELVGWCLFSGKALQKAVELHPELDENYFENKTCGALYRACADFITINQGKGIDVTDVLNRASKILKGKKSAEQLQKVLPDFEQAYLDSRKAVLPINAGKYFTQKVIDACNHRRIKELGLSLVDVSESPTGDVLEQFRALVNDFENKFTQDKTGLVSWAELFSKTIKALQQGETRHVQPTGFPQLDSLLNGGFYDGTFNIISGRPSAGKTALAIDIASNIARDPKAKGSVVIYSFEMTNQEIITRLFGWFSGKSLKQIMRSPDAYSKIAEEFKKIGEASGKEFDTDRLILSDRSNVTVPQIRAELTAINKEHGLSAVVIDYIGLMHEKGKFETRNVELGHISFGLRSIAKDLQVPFIVVAQMGRQGEGESGTPKASFLRDSGSLEQDADTIIMLTTPDEPDATGAREVKLHIVKNRFNAITGGKPLNLEFRGASNSFYEMGRAELPPVDSYAEANDGL